jgi:hypothetical protein
MRRQLSTVLPSWLALRRSTKRLGSVTLPRGIQAYAKIRDDFESQQRFAEIRLRACQRIGEISRDLETRQGQKQLRPSERTKSELLADAGITLRTAERYQNASGSQRGAKLILRTPPVRPEAMEDLNLVVRRANQERPDCGYGWRPPIRRAAAFVVSSIP